MNPSFRRYPVLKFFKSHDSEKSIAMTKVRTFISNNLVILVMVPVIIGGHYGWYKLQGMEELVPPKEHQEMPLVAAFRKFFGETSATQPTKAK